MEISFAHNPIQDNSMTYICWLKMKKRLNWKYDFQNFQQNETFAGQNNKMKNTINRKLYTYTHGQESKLKRNIQYNRTRPPPLKILFSLTFGVFVDSPVFPFLLEMLHDRCLLLYCYIIVVQLAHSISKDIEEKRRRRRKEKKHTNRTHLMPFCLFCT